MPPGLSPAHLLVIFVVALIVLGPEKGPEAIGKGARLLGDARQWMARAAEELQSAVSLPIEEPTVPPAQLTASAPGGADAGGEAPDQPPAEGAAPPGVVPVADAALRDAVPMSSPPGPAAAVHPPVQEERHL